MSWLCSVLLLLAGEDDGALLLKMNSVFQREFFFAWNSHYFSIWVYSPQPGRGLIMPIHTGGGGVPGGGGGVPGGQGRQAEICD